MPLTLCTHFDNEIESAGVYEMSVCKHCDISIRRTRGTGCYEDIRKVLVVCLMMLSVTETV